MTSRDANIIKLNDNVKKLTKNYHELNTYNDKMYGIYNQNYRELIQKYGKLDKQYDILEEQYDTLKEAMTRTSREMGKIVLTNASFQTKLKTHDSQFTTIRAQMGKTYDTKLKHIWRSIREQETKLTQACENKMDKLKDYVNEQINNLATELQTSIDQTVLSEAKRNKSIIMKMDYNLKEVLDVMKTDVFRALREPNNADKIMGLINGQLKQLKQLEQLNRTLNDIQRNTNFREGNTTFSDALRQKGDLIAGVLNNILSQHDDGTWSHLQKLQELVGHMVDPNISRMKDEIVREIYKHAKFPSMDSKKINDALMKLEKITINNNITIDDMDDTIKEIKKNIKPLRNNVNTLLETFVGILKATKYINEIYIPIPTSTTAY